MTTSSPSPDPRTRFSDRVADYVRYRPDYPEAVMATLVNEGLGPDSEVADVGSGTGIFSAALLGSGATVYGVEPNAAMRAAAEAMLGGEARFRSVAGSAEATGLADGSVDLVTAAQAFHWFDREAARSEFRRILRPQGLVALVWNDRREASTPFLREYEALLQRYGTDYAKVNHRNVDPARIREFYGPAVQRRSFSHFQELDRDGIRGRLLSSSYTPREGDPARAPMLTELDAIFARHARDGLVRLEYDTELYLGRVKSEG